MTIQLSVLIWTVICFVVFMLVLNRFLFTPIHEVMDKRRSRVEEAKALHQGRVDAYNEALAERERKKKGIPLPEEEETPLEERIAREDTNREEMRQALDAYRLELREEETRIRGELAGTSSLLADNAVSRIAE